MTKPLIQLGSLDLFWMPRLAAALAPMAEVELISTWSLKKPSPQIEAKMQNLWVLHYLLMLYKVYPQLKFKNHTYTLLCKIFDRHFSNKLNQGVKVISFLNGFGLSTMKQARVLGAKSVIECGCSHVDFQNEIVEKEYKLNGIRYSLFPETYRNRLRKELELADYIQVASKFALDSYLDYGIPRTKLLTAHYGYDPKSFFAKEQRSLDDKPFRFICPSGVNLRKGARILVEAWKKAEFKNAELHWIGKPTAETEHLFDPMPKGIIFEQWRSQAELGELYRSCDAMVLPTLEDGFGMVIVEAAACGLPVIITPNCCAHEFFSSGKPEGWLVGAGNSDELVEAMREAVANPSKTLLKGDSAAKKAQKFTWSQYGNQVRENYSAILV